MIVLCTGFPLLLTDTVSAKAPGESNSQLAYSSMIVTPAFMAAYAILVLGTISLGRLPGTVCS